MVVKTYNTESVSVPPIWVIHRRNVDPTLVHDIVIGDHDSSEGSQEYGVPVHETEESLGAGWKSAR
jgi:hypothetical protein